MSTYTIGITGNPNCGKTTAFNAMTGAHQHVGNWPGVTVEKKFAHVSRNGDTLEMVDLPGTYSLTAYTQEELVARNFLVEDRPGSVIDILNADALERNLYLAVQIMELGVPMVLGLNMMDEVRGNGKEIDSARLAQLTGCAVVETVARHGQGTDDLIDASLKLARERGGKWSPLTISYGPDLDPVLAKMITIIEEAGFMTDKVPARWTGIKYLEADEDVIAKGRTTDPAVSAKLEAMAEKVGAHTMQTLKAMPDALIADYRYGFIASIIKEVVAYPVLDEDRISRSDRMDRVLTHTVLGPLIMVGIVYLIYKVTFTVGEIPMGWLESLFGLIGDAANAALPDGYLRSLIVSGIIDGVGGVLGFVPLIIFMFLMISALEDSGYVARMAYMLDRVFKIFGLHGTSVLPFIVSGGIAGGCAVPGVMSARTLRSPREKLATLFVAPYMTCGAKVPVYLMLTAAFFPSYAAQLMLVITLTAWCMALLVARALRSTVIRGESTPFVMELPPYRIPTLKGVLIHTWERTWEYVKKAGTVILGISILIWAMMTFPQLPADRVAHYDALRAAAQSETAVTDIDNQQAEEALLHTMAGRIGTALEPLTKYAGFNWRVNIALTGGFAAKEVVVSALGTAYSMGDVDPEDSKTLSERLVADKGFTTASAVALILFTMLYAPCFVTVVTMARESSWRWAAFSVVGSTTLAFVMAVIGYNVTRLIM